MTGATLMQFALALFLVSKGLDIVGGDPAPVLLLWLRLGLLGLAGVLAVAAGVQKLRERRAGHGNG
jgi:hypothetical protein